MLLLMQKVDNSVQLCQNCTGMRMSGDVVSRAEQLPTLSAAMVVYSCASSVAHTTNNASSPANLHVCIPMWECLYNTQLDAFQFVTLLEHAMLCKKCSK